jgi:hypothetical protein
MAANSVTSVRKFDGLEVKERECPPPLAETLVDHRGLAFAGSNAQAHHHLLDEMRYWQQK